MTDPSRPDGPGRPPPGVDPSQPGPLDRATALALLDQADRLIQAGDVEQAGALYRRVFGNPDRDISAAALLGLGNVLYRLDGDQSALPAWKQAIDLGESAATYAAWRQVAAAQVRLGDLPAALRAYREAERRAPPEDRAEIASRLGWLSKETGDRRAAGRYFARSRASGPTPWLTYVIVAITVGVSVTAWFSPDWQQIYAALEFTRAGVAAGEYWRLFTVALLHFPFQEGAVFALIHLGFNMYALFLVGPIVEQLYGTRTYGLMYLLATASGSVGTFLLGSGAPGVGASGAIFGLFGVLFAASRAHRPAVDRRSQAMIGQVGGIIVFNLLLGFGLGGGIIDNFAHLGGLAAGLWLGFILPPSRIRTLASMWQQPAAPPAASAPIAPSRPIGAGVLLPVLGVVALVVALVIGIVVGTDAQRGPGQGADGSSASTASGAAVVVDPPEG